MEFSICREGKEFKLTKSELHDAYIAWRTHTESEAFETELSENWSWFSEVAEVPSETELTWELFEKITQDAAKHWVSDEGNPPADSEAADIDDITACLNRAVRKHAQSIALLAEAQGLSKGA